jgi:hypothetical protein
VRRSLRRTAPTTSTTPMSTASTTITNERRRRMSMRGKRARPDIDRRWVRSNRQAPASLLGTSLKARAAANQTGAAQGRSSESPSLTRTGSQEIGRIERTVTTRAPPGARKMTRSPTERPWRARPRGDSADTRLVNGSASSARTSEMSASPSRSWNRTREPTRTVWTSCWTIILRILHGAGYRPTAECRQIPDDSSNGHAPWPRWTRSETCRAWAGAQVSSVVRSRCSPISPSSTSPRDSSR